MKKLNKRKKDMEFNEFLQLIRRKKQTILTLILVGTMMVILISLLYPLKYGVNSRLLVIQNYNNDTYSLSRSNEYLGNLLAEVVYSSSFYDKTLNSKYNIDKNYFNGNYSQQLKKWHKTVATKTKQDTGIIEINVYHPQISEAKKIALAVNDILINNNQDYHSGQNIKINVIDQPLTSNYPVKPNLPYNGGIAAGISFLFALFYIYIFPEKKYSLYLFGRPSYKKEEQNSKEIKKNQSNDNDENIDLKGNIHNIVK
jgi:capsular polysaccharide biosynthesis protein